MTYLPASWSAYTLLAAEIVRFTRSLPPDCHHWMTPTPLGVGAGAV
ncbi:hypothetical protein J7E97_20800 [Streptomyces sp. ISL-66]|nr:hypothetical protein [Streptomyces sp. ISL-66]MBT2470247.1 hypothetical protein [Streptomyces sp. ISL-66]